MDILRVNTSEKDKLYRSLDSYCRSFIKRGVSFVIQAHSGQIGSIDITVNGKRGIASKNIVVSYDSLLEEWVCITDGYEYHMLGLSDIGTILRSKIQQLSNVVTKL